MQGGEYGTRNSALAARRADTGDHSVVVVLRPLTVKILHLFRLCHSLAEPDFFANDGVEFSQCRRAFSLKFRYDA
jgi:hypothetical protein